jgi:hypothetical protein
VSGTTSVGANRLRMIGVLQEASALPLPASATPVARTGTMLPLCGITRTASGADVAASTRHIEVLLPSGGVVDMAASLTQTVTAVSNLAVTRGLAADLAVSGTIGATLNATVAMAAAPTVSVTVGATLGAIRPMAADLVSSVVIGAALQNLRNVASDLTGAGTLGADLGVTRNAAAALTASVTVGADMQAAAQLAADIAGATVVTLSGTLGPRAARSSTTWPPISPGR